MASMDERIVSMKFDNKQFESGVKSTLESLKNLKEGLNFSRAIESLKNLGKTSTNTSFESLANSVDNVTTRFTKLDIVGITCLQRITNAAINTGTKMIKSLSTDQIVSGMTKYEEKTKAMQTIMAATGLTIEEVNEQVSKLNWYTDETSYNFTDMVSNVGKFTAQGVDLKEAVQAMEGIANWAAVSGQGINQASRAMYNLSQALGLGSVRVQDWMSIENANMATEEFKNQVIETAKELGTLNGDLEVTASNFRTTLSEGWFTNDVLIAVLNKYGQYSEQIYQIVEETGMTAAQAMDYLTEHAEELGIEIGTLGEKSFKAAQEAKTFTEAIDAAKDAVSTGWMTTFELLFGNYEEAKELWTDLANGLYGIFAEGINEQNELLEIWKEMGGRTVLIEGLTGAFRDLLLVVSPIKRAMASVFPVTADGIYDLTVKFRDLINNLWMSQQTFDSLVKVFEGLFSVVKLVALAISGVYKAIKPVLTMIRTLAAVVVYAAGCLGEFVTAFVEILDQSGIFNEFASIIQNALISIGGLLITVIASIVNFIAEASELPIVATIFNSIKSAGSIMFNAIYPMLTKLISIIGSIITTVANALSTINIISPIDLLNAALTLLYTIVISVISAIGGLFNILSSGALGIITAIPKGIIAIANGFKSVVDSIKSFIGLKLNSVLDTLEVALTKAKDALSQFAEVVKNVPYKQLFAFAAAILYLYTAWQVALLIGSISSFFKSASLAITDVAQSTKGVMQAVESTIKNTSRVIGTFEKTVDRSFWTSTIMQVAVGIGIIAVSLGALSFIDTNKLIEVAKVLGVLAVGFVALSVISSIINGIIGKSLGDSKISGLASNMLALGVASLLLVSALKVLVNAGKSLKEMMPALNALGILLAEFVLTVGLIGILPKKLTSGVGTIIAVSIAIKLVISALNDLAAINSSKLTVLTESLATIIEILTSLVLATKLGSFSGALGSIVMIGSVLILVEALKYLNDNIESLDLSKLVTNINKMIPVAAGLIAFAVISRIAGKNSLSTGLGLIGAATAMVILIQTFSTIKTLSTNQLNKIKGMLAVVGVIASGLVLVSAKSKNMMKVGASFILMSAAFAAIVAIVSFMKDIEVETLLKGAGMIAAVGIIAAGLVAVTALTKNAKVAPIIAMVAMIGVLVGSLAVLTLFDTSALVAAGLAMCVGLSGMASVLMALSNFDSNGIIKTIGIVIVIIAMIVGIAGSIYVLQNIPWQSLLSAAGAMSIAFVALAVALNNLHKVTIDKSAIVGIVVGVAAMYGLTYSISRLAEFDWTSLIGAGASMALAFIGLTAGLRVLSGVKVDASGIAGIAAGTLSMIGIAYSLSMIAMYDWTSLIAAAGSLAIAIAAVSVAALISGDSADGAVALIAMGVAVIEFAAALSILGAVDTTSLIANLGLLGAALVALLIASAITTAVPGFSAAMISVAAALVTFGIAAIAFSVSATLFAVAINLIANALLTLSTIGPEAANNIGYTIQTIMTSIASGFVQCVSIVTSAVYELGGQIVQGLINGVIDSVSGIWEAAQTLGSNVINGLKDILRISSPSEETEEIGMYSGDGLENGLEKSESGVYNAATELGSKVVDGITDKTSDAITAGSNIATGAAEGVSAKDQLFSLLGGLLGTSTGDGLSGSLSYIQGKGGNLISSVVDALKDPSSKLFESLGAEDAKAFLEELTGGISNGVDVIFNAFTDDEDSDGSGISDIFKKALEDAVPELDDLTESLGGVGSSAGSAAGSTSDLTDEIKTNTKYTKYLSSSITSYSSKLKSLTNNTIDDTSATKLATTAINSYAEALYDAQRAADGLSDVEEDAETRTKNIKETFIDAYESYQSAISGAMSLYSTFDYTLETTSSDMLKAIRSNVTGMKGAISSIGTLISKGFNSDLIYELMEDLPGNISEIQALVSMNADQITSYNKLYEQYIALQSEGAAELIAYAAACKSSGKSFEQFKSEVISSGTATEELISIVDSLEDSFDGITDTTYGVVKSVNEIGAACQAAYDSLNELLQSQVDYFEEFETDDDVDYDSMYEGLESQYEAYSKWGEMFSSIAQRTGDDGQEFMQMLADMGIESYDYLQALNYSTDEEIQDIVDMFNQLNSYIPTVAEKVTNTMSTVYNAFGIQKETYDILKQQAEDTGDAIADGVEQGITNGTSDVQNAATDMAESTVTAVNSELQINSPSKVTEESGKYFVEGLTEGINNDDCRNRLVRAIKNMAEEMISALEDKLEVNSPSERTTAIGEFLDLGLIQGLSNLTGKVKTAAQSVAEGTMDAISSGLNSISDLMSDDLDNTLVITPVLDLTNVQSGLGSMNAMLTDPSYGIGMSGINLDSVSRNNSAQTAIPTKTDNSDVVNAVNSLKTEMAGIKTGLNNMKIVLDTGVMAGAVAQGVSAKIQNGVKKKEVVWA